MSGSRLGGSLTPVNPVGPCSKLHIKRYESMMEALIASRRSPFKRNPKDYSQNMACIRNRPVGGDSVRLAKAMDESDKLIEEAIGYDSRLARRANWVRWDEGEHVDSALLATGDDAPFYKRTKATVNDAAASGEPLRVVLSTDSNRVMPGTAAAFIATARLVQQFQPLEIWWQGAWLNKNNTEGFVIHVPLVAGDVDFSRLEFCIADNWRDTFSYYVMTAYAVLDARETNAGNGYRAERSYIFNDYESPNRAKFVSHTGIEPSGSSIAQQAARWLGWECYWMENYNQEEQAKSALQSLPEKNTPYVDRRTPQEKAKADLEGERYWQEQKRKREQEAARGAASRLAA